MGYESVTPVKFHLSRLSPQLALVCSSPATVTISSCALRRNLSEAAGDRHVLMPKWAPVMRNPYISPNIYVGLSVYL